MPEYTETKTNIPENLYQKIKGVIENDLEEAKPELAFKNFSSVLISFYFVIFGSFMIVFIGSYFLTLWNLIFLIFPLAAIIICNYYWKKAKDDLIKEIKNFDSSESEVTRIIDKYSGIIDGIGTALPLIGAAFLLGVVSADIEDPVTKDFWFIKTAIPVELLSILMLAAAKLFEPAFDQLSVIFQNVIDHAKRVEMQFYHEETLKEIRTQSSGAANKTLPDTSKIENEKLVAISELLDKMDKSINGLKDPNVVKSLESLIELIGVNKNDKK